MEEKKKAHYIIPIFVPHSGCPHDCIFCNQKKITDQLTEMNSDKAIDIIDEYLDYFDREAYIEIAFYGGSFTAIDLDKQRDLLEVAYDYKSRGLVDAIRMSTRPDAISPDILEHLSEYGVDTVELGVQSMDQEVLNLSGRGHNDRVVYDSVELLKKYGFKFGLQMMLGLPGDNLDKDIYTVQEFIKLDPDCVRIYPTLLIKDTYLEELYLRGDYEPLSVEEAVEISSIILILFEKNNINVIRLGLQATDNIQMGKDVLAGPFHPAFRQLVESKIYRQILDGKLGNIEGELKDQELIVYANNSIISNIVGQKASNKAYFIDKYKLKKIRFKARENQAKEIVNLEYRDKKIEIDILEEKEILLNRVLEK